MTTQTICTPAGASAAVPAGATLTQTSPDLWELVPETGATLNETLQRLTRQVQQPNSYPIDLFLPLYAAIASRLSERQVWLPDTAIADDAQAIADCFEKAGHRFWRCDPLTAGTQAFWQAQKHDTSSTRHFAALAQAEAFIGAIEAQEGGKP